MLGRSLGLSLGTKELQDGSHTEGQKKSSLFPSIGSVCLQRTEGLSVTHFLQFFFFFLLNRKVGSSSHTPRVGGIVGSKDGATVGMLQSGLHIEGQKTITFSFVMGSVLLQRSDGLAATHFLQFFFFLLLNRKAGSSSQLDGGRDGAAVVGTLDGTLDAGNSTIESPMLPRSASTMRYSPSTTADSISFLRPSTSTVGEVNVCST